MYLACVSISSISLSSYLQTQGKRLRLTHAARGAVSHNLPSIFYLMLHYKSTDDINGACSLYRHPGLNASETNLHSHPISHQNSSERFLMTYKRNFFLFLFIRRRKSNPPPSPPLTEQSVIISGPGGRIRPTDRAKGELNSCSSFN